MWMMIWYDILILMIPYSVCINVNTINDVCVANILIMCLLILVILILIQYNGY